MQTQSILTCLWNRDITHTSPPVEYWHVILTVSPLCLRSCEVTRWVTPRVMKEHAIHRRPSSLALLTGNERLLGGKHILQLGCGIVMLCLRLGARWDSSHAASSIACCFRLWFFFFCTLTSLTALSIMAVQLVHCDTCSLMSTGHYSHFW